MTSIYAEIPDHLKMLFRDVTNEAFDEVHGGNGFGDKLVILVTSVVEGAGIIHLVVGINTGSSNDRAPKISADVFQNLMRVTFSWF